MPIFFGQRRFTDAIVLEFYRPECALNELLLQERNGSLFPHDFKFCWNAWKGKNRSRILGIFDANFFEQVFAHSPDDTGCGASGIRQPLRAIRSQSLFTVT